MALTNSFELFGATFEGSYHRITNLNYTIHEYQQTVYSEPSVDENGDPLPAEPTEEWVSECKANFQVSVYVNEDARDNFAQPMYVGHHEFTPDWSSEENILAQAYSYLKSLDEYEGSVDV